MNRFTQMCPLRAVGVRKKARRLLTGKDQIPPITVAPMGAIAVSRVALTI